MKKAIKVKNQKKVLIRNKDRNNNNQLKKLELKINKLNHGYSMKPTFC